MSGVDLHCHSKYSDGFHEPPALIKVAKREGLEGVAITDHDTTEAHRRMMPEDLAGIKVYTGVEMHAKVQGLHTVEILGLFIDPYDSILEDICKMNQACQLNRILTMGEKVGKAYDVKFSYEEFLKMVGGAKSAFNINTLADYFVGKKVFKDRDDALRRCLDKHSTEKNCYESMTSVPVDDVVDGIQIAGGVPVWCHPEITARYSGMGIEGYLSLIKKMKNKVRAIEVGYPYDKARSHINEKYDGAERFWSGVANELKLIKTSGSDYHGDSDKRLRLGERKTSLRVVKMLQDLCFGKR